MPGLFFFAAECVGLEATCIRGLLWSVRAPASSANIFVGSVAAAATTGALIGIGRRAGSAGYPFAATAAVLFHRTPSAAAVGLVFVGLVLHVVLSFVWARIFIWLAEGPVHRDLVAAGTVALAQLAIGWVAASITGAGIASAIALGDRVVLAVVMAVALVTGMRFARGVSRIA
jgi:hypothetical protein